MPGLKIRVFVELYFKGVNVKNRVRSADKVNNLILGKLRFVVKQHSINYPNNVNSKEMTISKKHNFKMKQTVAQILRPRGLSL